MRWGRRSPTDRPPRPKVRRLAVDEREQVLAEMNKAVQRSPVLQAFRVEAYALRSQFYLHWHWESAEDASSEVCRRITPLTEPKDDFLLEIEHRQSMWSGLLEPGRIEPSGLPGKRRHTGTSKTDRKNSANSNDNAQPTPTIRQARHAPPWPTQTLELSGAFCWPLLLFSLR
jgi:hypothetical protein